MNPFEIEQTAVSDPPKVKFSLDKIKLAFGIAALASILCTVPMPTTRYLYVGGLAGAAFFFLILLVLALPDDKKVPGVPALDMASKMASKFIWFFPDLGFIGILVWYATICYKNSESIQQGTMPDNWSAFGWVIYFLMLAHLAIVLMGGEKYSCLAWLTMSFLLVFVTMQFIQADFFKTEGFHM